MPQHRNAEDFFRDLQSHPIQGTESQIRTGVTVAHGDVRGFHNAEGSIGLVIPVSVEEHQAFRPDLKSQAIRLTKLTADNDPFIRLSLLDGSQQKIFAVFVDEVLKELEKSPETAPAVAAAMLQRWRRLFTGRASAESFTPAQEIGLLCELEVLQKLLNFEGPQALERWSGPESLPHDFELEDESIECKATSSVNGLRVSIHGIHQLQPTTGKELRLVIRQYESNPDGDLSVPELCRAIYERPDVSVDVFLEKLDKANCPVFHQDADTVFQRYSPIGSFEFLVYEDFPRIDPVGAEQRIQQVNYVLDLSGPETVPGFQKTNNLLPNRE